ncbi:isoprenyl transferase [Fretibacter rubidus]|uniref:isoprenyl transferase n=1 Tax=Fretibacter rubidus TaxID=570162 RepID=UPI00352AE1D8
MSQSRTYQPTVPLHVAIIMDGNGRWAQARRRPRVFGHQAGVKTVRRIVEDAADIGIKHLTLYSFSTENWTRPKTEIAALFQLLKSYVADDLDTLNANNVRIRILGSREGLTNDLLQTIEKVEKTTQSNTDFFLNIAFNYGGRDEIMRAVKTAVKRFDVDTMTESDFSSCLDTSDIPDPDMVIRTSGEKRISNFLMWQAAYAEFIFTDVLWPDFTRQDLEDAISEYGTRRRRFGALDVDANAADVA